jgi:glutathione-regulated potassium-efflux system protein KefB
MATDAHELQLYPILALLAAAVVAGSLFKRIGFGSVLGYLVAGIAVGPHGFEVMTNPAAILQVAELGVVLFLFIIGLEMRPTRLWALRGEIFGLGVSQFVACLALLALLTICVGGRPIFAFVAAAGFVMTSTAVVVQSLADQHAVQTEQGQPIVSILLLEDLTIVPLLATVGVIAQLERGGSAFDVNPLHVLAGIAAIVCVAVTARYLLNPLFRLVAAVDSRDVMSAAALLVVLGSAYALQLGGFSMAMGAFLAGVFLADSSFRNQLEVDVEPFRAMLLGLFFLAVGMSLDIAVAAAAWPRVAAFVVLFMSGKALGIYVVARLFGAAHQEALSRAGVMAQGGEFAFVLFGASAAAGLLTRDELSQLSAVVILSMMLTPVVSVVVRRTTRTTQTSPEAADKPIDLAAPVLIVGFGRIGQIASQLLIARGWSVSILDKDFTIIKAARNFDVRVYYGDGTQLDVLYAAGAKRARAVLVCVDDVAATTRIVQLLRSEFDHAGIVARSFDRRHTLELIRAGAHFHVRETFESALLIGSCALELLGTSETEIAESVARLRDSDCERLKRDLVGGIEMGDVLFSRPPKSEAC